MTRLAELNKEMARIRKTFQEDGQKMFAEAAQELFDRFPKLESIVLTGYAPSFNDGDPCLFSMREYESTVNGVSLD